MKDQHRTSSAAEDVLADHRPEYRLDVSGPLYCSCGYATQPGDRRADFEAHQASALAGAGVLR